MSRFAIGDEVTIAMPFRTVKGKIVHIFHANELPEESFRMKYYGKEKVGAKRITVDRYVIEYADGEYLIAPDTQGEYIHGIYRNGGN